jgi:hypothetical protein
MESPARYHIRLQPDVEQLITDPGVRDFELTLTPEQLDGIMAMSETLFPQYTRSHIAIDGPHGSVVHLRPDILVTPYLLEAFGERLDRARAQGLPWRQAIQVIFARRADPITRRYTALLTSLDETMSRYVQFDRPEFLQGAISVLQWFDVEPWEDHIMDLHDDDTAVEIVNLSDYELI